MVVPSSASGTPGAPSDDGVQVGQRIAGTSPIKPYVENLTRLCDSSLKSSPNFRLSATNVTTCIVLGTSVRIVGFPEVERGDTRNYVRTSQSYTLQYLTLQAVHGADAMVIRMWA
ncbi:uncharacterized protein CLUP02_07008 [Colletotrichum lupini]|uniref:Uncharacterized protein n=1 Tax=Colletotrichum lupini TaxID=145971 RepID=A0A9Q8SQ66_9PEZI|nr:uncharacterized protein CLUP02_07008 [Colletotrichum lupini]UQC81522.1 hypothetical protein CLUP02_07008 [Colletotrichum lupini]